MCKPDGRLLLLEHGRATSDWVNQRLDGQAEQHCAKFGCHWNRPILDIVSEVRRGPGRALCQDPEGCVVRVGRRCWCIAGIPPL